MTIAFSVSRFGSASVFSTDISSEHLSSGGFEDRSYNNPNPPPAPSPPPLPSMGRKSPLSQSAVVSDEAPSTPLSRTSSGGSLLKSMFKPPTPDFPPPESSTPEPTSSFAAKLVQAKQALSNSSSD